jgi:predicted transcriptional regulator
MKKRAKKRTAFLFILRILNQRLQVTGNRWMMTFQDSLIEIAKDKDFTSPAKTILFFLMGSLDFENYIHLRQADIVKELEMQKSHVSTAMKLLVNKGIILKVKEGRTAGYKLNPHYGWKGQISNRNKEIDRIVKQRVVDLKDYVAATRKKED